MSRKFRKPGDCFILHADHFTASNPVQEAQKFKIHKGIWAGDSSLWVYYFSTVKLQEGARRNLEQDRKRIKLRNGKRSKWGKVTIL